MKKITFLTLLASNLLASAVMLNSSNVDFAVSSNGNIVETEQFEGESIKGITGVELKNGVFLIIPENTQVIFRAEGSNGGG